jgi:hypothetical protein
MSTISIAITSCSNEAATLKVLRSYTTASLGRLRQVIGTHEPALIFSTIEYPIEMEDEEGQKQEQRRIIDACNRLEETGAVLELGYAPSRNDPFEVIDPTFMMNLFESDIEYLRQEHE